ncbi:MULTISPECIES: lipid-A-disaccharide synthase N-terminal domain-containing protein [Pontibacter]|uniref:Lauroyl acyltransferase n=3 Tax=Pseudomonadati TaxID=3379134 RepID=A0A501WJQ8_9RHOB|nr:MULTISPECIES: lipid-A-disaccharide synthase N-terminal domain-containing protein [Pontibacter]ARS37557.1 lauroyl acyltransferase [Pontibacter actiniarum]TPE41547.1 lauroyl acyltransferase [Pontibacter mangrovi]TPE48675.1 lauroyl acyltransferase [Amaricoccus solimangrovi]
MDVSELSIYGVGLLAQALFSARILIQWITSEKAGRVLSPASFWTTSIIASMLLMAYGALRNDIVIVGGQLVSYFIYLRNIKLKNVWEELAWPFRWGALMFPFAATGWLLWSDTYSFSYILEHSKISGALIAWGGAGQVVFTLRFVYQWWHSERVQESVIPIGFWVISLVGSLMIISYAVLRLDPVLFLGQMFGVVAYSRNFILGLREQRSARKTSPYHT